jgi:hypothetical protein
MDVNKDSIWTVFSRGFQGEVRVLEDVDTEEDTFFEVEIRSGTKSYLSLNRNCETVGEIISLRTSLTRFMQQEAEIVEEDDGL